MRYEGTPTVPPPSVLAEAHKFNLRHPYSLSEFKGDISDEEFDLHRRVQMQQMDTLDQQFWTDVSSDMSMSTPHLMQFTTPQSNQRFEAAKRATLWALPLGASSIDKEKALSDFYTGWVAQERLRQHEYTKQHRSAVLTELAIAARYEYRRVKGLFGRSA